MKSIEKNQAIALRKKGKSYSEILAEVDVAKSTLSLWFRSVNLAKPQKQRLTDKKKQAALRGAFARHQARLIAIENSIAVGITQIGKISLRELWLIGIALYWAEGSKQNSRSPSAGIMFANSDYRMINLFLNWLKQVGVSDSAIYFELYVHKDRRTDVQDFRQWWAKRLHVPISRVNRIYLKKGNVLTNRTNVGHLYHGLLRIKVNSSTNLNRRISGWVEGIVASLGSGVIGNTSAFGAEDFRFEPWLPSK